MKRFFTAILSSALLFLSSCSDISSMFDELDYLDGRADAVAAWIAEMEAEAESLRNILRALNDKDGIVDIEFIYDENTLEALSCKIFFEKAEPVMIILKGAKGEQGDAGVPGGPGADGADGPSGADGTDGRKPFISIGEYEGSYYWKADGEWILDDKGERLPVNSETAFRMKVEEGRWFVSFDEGVQWMEIDPFEYEFSGVSNVIPSEDKVGFVLEDGTVVNLPLKKNTGAEVVFRLSKEGCLDAVPGATYRISYTFSGAEDAEVSVFANSRMGEAYVVPSSTPGSGNIHYTLSEQYDLKEQKLMVVLTHKGGTVTRILTFAEKGRLMIDPVAPVAAEGGECIITSSLTGYSYMNVEVTAGSGWFRFASTSSYGHVYQVDPNTSEESRYAEISFTVIDRYFTTLFTKKIQVVQFGTGTKAGYYEYLGSWTMSGTDALTGQEVNASVRVVKNEGLSNSYLIYGLSPASGASLPVYADYETATGLMKLTLPQTRLDGTEIGLYPAAVSGKNIVKAEGQKTFIFRAEGNSMTADMDMQSSFVYMDENGTVSPDDRIFYTGVSLVRDGVSKTYNDGEVVMLNKASESYTPLNIVILGDGYQRKDLKQGGKFERSARGAVSSLFAVEPFASFKDRFDIYMVPFASKDEGPDVTASGIVRDTYFSSTCAGGGNTLVTCSYDKVLSVVNSLGLTEQNYDLYRTIVILLVNTTEQSGSCWYIKGGKTDTSNVGDGIKSMAIAMLAADTMGSNGLIRHEAGGHAFGRLADEYNWGGKADDAKKASLLDQQNNYGFYLNVTAETGPSSPWARFIGLDGYDDVGYHEGAWGCSSGLYRPTANSIMLNNQGHFNAPSREIIYKRIILQTEGPGAYTFERFLAYDKKNL